jgi:hypothetical protein
MKEKLAREIYAWKMVGQELQPMFQNLLVGIVILLTGVWACRLFWLGWD